MLWIIAVLSGVSTMRLMLFVQPLSFDEKSTCPETLYSCMFQQAQYFTFFNARGALR